MAHARKQIRDAVKTALTGLATTGANVFASRSTLLTDLEMPALLIYTLGEVSEPAAMGTPPRLERTLSVAVEGAAKATAALDDTLDAIAAEAEAALAADVTLGGLAKASWLASTEIRLNAEAEQPTGAIRMIFDVIYHTIADAPETAV